MIVKRNWRFSMRRRYEAWTEFPVERFDLNEPVHGTIEMAKEELVITEV